MGFKTGIHLVFGVDVTALVREHHGERLKFAGENWVADDWMYGDTFYTAKYMLSSIDDRTEVTDKAGEGGWRPEEIACLVTDQDGHDGSVTRFVLSFSDVITEYQGNMSFETLPVPTAEEMQQLELFCKKHFIREKPQYHILLPRH